MQAYSDEGDPTLLDLAQATEQVAASIADPFISTRLRGIAAEVRRLAHRAEEAHGGKWPPSSSSRDPNEVTCLLA